MAERRGGEWRLANSMPLPGARTAGRWAGAIVALAIGAAVLGAATGARVAAEAEPAAEALAEPAPAPRATPSSHSVKGRVVGVRGDFIVIRPPGGEPVRVHVLPRTVIRHDGQKADLSAVKRGDRALAVGRMNDNGVLQARGIVARPPRPRPPAQAAPESPARSDPTEAS
jgi:hypothetical protein